MEKLCRKLWITSDFSPAYPQLIHKGAYIKIFFTAAFILAMILYIAFIFAFAVTLAVAITVTFAVTVTAAFA